MISKNRIKFVRSLEMKKFRKANGVFVAEGHKLVGDLLNVFECKYLAATTEWLDAHTEWLDAQTQGLDAHAQKVDASFKQGLEVDEVTEEELRRISFQETPQQVLAVFKQPVYAVDVQKAVRENLCLMLDDVQNPGNLGTIVRLADWFGIEHVFCSKGCADIYNPKTVQATMGGMARVKVHYVDLAETLASLDVGTPVYGTFLDGENMYGKQLSKSGVIVMGNEGNGISKAVEEYVTERLYIPNYPVGRKTSESLNVAIATAIVCAEFRR